MPPQILIPLSPLSELKGVKMICEGTTGVEGSAVFPVWQWWAWCQEGRMPEKSEVLAHPGAGQSERPET